MAWTSFANAPEYLTAVVDLFMGRLTNSEQGTISEAEFVKATILTSGGLVVPTRPAVDDEERDVNLHLRKHFVELAVQCKSAWRLIRHGRQHVLQITFYVKPPIFSSPQFWYFIGYFNPSTMTFAEPVYLIPSSFLHKHARRGMRRRDGAIRMQVNASLALNSHDQWTPYRLTVTELGPRIVEILKDLAMRRLSAEPELRTPIEGAIILAARARPQPAKIRRAA